METNHLAAAHEQLTKAKGALCMAVSSFQKAGDCFDGTIRELKETIGDLECSIFELEKPVDASSVKD